MNISDLKNQFLEHLEIEKNRSQKTLQNYDHYLKRFFGFSKIQNPDDISEASIRKFRVYLNRYTDQHGNTLKKLTQNYHIIALRAFLKYLAKHDIKAIAAEKVELGKQEEREVSFLDSNDLLRFLSSPEGNRLKNIRDRALLETLFSTGMRVSEICALNKDDIDNTRGEITIRGKGGKLRLVFLSETAKEKLKTYIHKRVDTDEALFIRIPRDEKFGRYDQLRLTPRSVQRIITQYAIKAGITGKKVTPHTLRHSMATELLRNGADIRSVQALLGHASVTTTQIYTHVTNEHLRETHKKYHRRKV